MVIMLKFKTETGTILTEVENSGYAIGNLDCSSFEALLLAKKKLKQEIRRHEVPIDHPAGFAAIQHMPVECVQLQTSDSIAGIFREFYKTKNIVFSYDMPQDVPPGHTQMYKGLTSSSRYQHLVALIVLNEQKVGEDDIDIGHVIFYVPDKMESFRMNTSKDHFYGLFTSFWPEERDIYGVDVREWLLDNGKFGLMQEPDTIDRDIVASTKKERRSLLNSDKKRNLLIGNKNVVNQERLKWDKHRLVRDIHNAEKYCQHISGKRKDIEITNGNENPFKMPKLSLSSQSDEILSKMHPEMGDVNKVKRVLFNIDNKEREQTYNGEEEDKVFQLQPKNLGGKKNPMVLKAKKVIKKRRHEESLDGEKDDEHEMKRLKRSRPKKKKQVDFDVEFSIKKIPEVTVHKIKEDEVAVKESDMENLIDSMNDGLSETIRAGLTMKNIVSNIRNKNHFNIQERYDPLSDQRITYSDDTRITETSQKNYDEQMHNITTEINKFNYSSPEYTHDYDAHLKRKEADGSKYLFRSAIYLSLESGVFHCKAEAVKTPTLSEHVLYMTGHQLLADINAKRWNNADVFRVFVGLGIDETSVIEIRADHENYLAFDYLQAMHKLYCNKAGFLKLDGKNRKKCESIFTMEMNLKSVLKYNGVYTAKRLPIHSDETLGVMCPLCYPNQKLLDEDLDDSYDETLQGYFGNNVDKGYFDYTIRKLANESVTYMDSCTTKDKRYGDAMQEVDAVVKSIESQNDESLRHFLWKWPKEAIDSHKATALAIRKAIKHYTDNPSVELCKLKEEVHHILSQSDELSKIRTMKNSSDFKILYAPIPNEADFFINVLLYGVEEFEKYFDKCHENTME